jgi:hypothetical protein
MNAMSFQPIKRTHDQTTALSDGQAWTSTTNMPLMPSLNPSVFQIDNCSVGGSQSSRRRGNVVDESPFERSMRMLMVGRTKSGGWGSDFTEDRMVEPAVDERTTALFVSKSPATSPVAVRSLNRSVGVNQKCYICETANVTGDLLCNCCTRRLCSTRSEKGCTCVCEVCHRVLCMFCASGAGKSNGSQTFVCDSCSGND